MKEQKHDILFSLILVAVSGFLCFSLGLFVSWKWGFAKQKVLIEYQATTTTVPVTESTTANGMIDINVATVEDLMQVDGIGETTAQNIIAYREKIGKYTFIEQLLDVDNIGEKKLESWKRYLTVGSAVVSTTTSGPLLIHLNSATKEDLMRIDGIGERMALVIIKHRENIGGFTDLKQLMDIDGIGEKRFNAWSPYLTLE